jgi:tetratricopeptide (TPR) repeat protein
MVQVKEPTPAKVKPLPSAICSCFLSCRLPPPTAAALALLMFACACGGSAPAGNAAQGAGSSANAGASVAASPQASAGEGGAGATADTSQLDAEVERLEKRAERNPGDDDALSELAKAYVRRGNALRAANHLREALLDYRRAQSADPDNPDAQRNAAEISPLVEGAQTGENGEPAPLPITPGVTDDGEKATPTPKKP